jgi:hypothetical protein
MNFNKTLHISLLAGAQRSAEKHGNPPLFLDLRHELVGSGVGGVYTPLPRVEKHR